MSRGINTCRYKKFVFWFLFCVLIAVIIESLSLGAIWLSTSLFDVEIRRTTDIFREQSHKIKTLLEPEHHLVYDSMLGWRYRANYIDAQHHMNSQGLRSNREYSPVADSGIIRVAAFGNSFIYCHEVVNEDSWTAMIEDIFPYMEVLNYGVGGYGTDQAYLRFVKEGLNLSPDVVIIGFAPINLRRVVNIYRRFISDREIPLVKPRFIINEVGNMILLPNPLPHKTAYEKYLRHPDDIIELGKNDYWYESAIYDNPLYDLSATVRLFTTLWVRVHNRYLDRNRPILNGMFNQQSTAFKIQSALLEKFVDEVKNSGVIPIVVIFPDRDSILRARRVQNKVFDPLVDYLKARSIDYIDLTSAFLDSDDHGEIKDWFMSGGHYSPEGNKIVAQRLGSEIQNRLSND